MKMRISLPFGSSCLVAAVATAVLTSGLAAVGRAPDDDDLGIVKGLVLAQEDAWNKGNLEGYMTAYWNSEELVVLSGSNRRQGWKATLEAYRKRYQAPGAQMGHLTTTELEVQRLGEESILVRARWSLKLKSETVGGWFTLIFRRTGDGWKIVHEHTSG